jgi:hypothetical protein
VTVDFWTELIQSGTFHRRLQSYHRATTQIDRFAARETRFKGIAAEYLQLYDSKEKQHSEKNVMRVMETVHKKITEKKRDVVMDENEEGIEDTLN